MANVSGSAAPLSRVLVCGHGLAAAMTVAALARALPAATRLDWLKTGNAPDSDMLYGTVTAPSAYEFNRAAGVEEPALILGSDSSFSWGTRYAHWGGHSWTQGFALPFPVVDGVVFHHYLAAAGGLPLEPLLMGAMAAARDVFAHPPRGPGETGQQPLARAEYGYQVDPAGYAALFEAALPPGRVQRIDGRIEGVEAGERGIAAIRLTDGTALAADLFVDCTGPDAQLLSALDAAFDEKHAIGLIWGKTAGPANRPLRTVTATDFGWQADTPLDGRVLRQAIHHPDARAAAEKASSGAIDGALSATTGRRRAAWAVNCVGIGHSALVIEPLTPSPMMLLERDIERLLTLLPASSDMSVERREYNRRFADDTDHAALFDRALVETAGLPDTPYWREARAAPIPEKLSRKLDLFAARGLLVAYDLEPYHPEDWTILHLGLGRTPARYDRLADRLPREQVAAFLNRMRHDIDKVAATLPPAHAYRTQFAAYLRRKQA
jgi:tryptophan 7-halogenase